MNTLDKMKLAVRKGYTCNPETGEVFGPKGNVVKNLSSGGYYKLDVWDADNKKNRQLLCHQFIWYFTKNEVPNCIDHINRNRTDNKISNLRNVTISENALNVVGKGVYLTKSGKYLSMITVDYKNIRLGLFNTPDEAHKAYLDAKKIYHNINGK